MDKLGYTSLFSFLTKLYAHKEYPGPYFEVEKGLYLTYHLISRVTTSKNIKQNLRYSSFYVFYKNFWIENYSNLNKYVVYCLLNMFFTTIKIRIYSALIKKS